MQPPNHFYPNNTGFGFHQHHQQPPPGMIYNAPIHNEVPTSSLMVNHSPPNVSPSSIPNHAQHQFNSFSSSAPISINLKQSAETIMMDSIKLNQYENTIYLNQLSHSKDFEIHRRKISSDLEQIKLVNAEVTQLKTQIKTLNEKRKEYLKSLYGNHAIINDEDEDEEDELDMETLLMEYEYNVNNDLYTPHHLPKSIPQTVLNNMPTNNTNFNTTTTTAIGNIMLNNNDQNNNYEMNNVNNHMNPLHSNNHTNLQSPPHHANSNKSMNPATTNTSVASNIPSRIDQVEEAQEVTISNNNHHSNHPITTSTAQQATTTSSTNNNNNTPKKHQNTTNHTNRQQQTPQQRPAIHEDDTSSVFTTTTNYSNNFRVTTPSKSKTPATTSTPSVNNTSKHNQSLNESGMDDTMSITSHTSRTSLLNKSKNKTNQIVESKKRKEIVDIDDSDDEDSKFSLFRSPKKPKQDISTKELIKLKKKQEIEKQKRLHLMNRFDEKEYTVMINNSTPPQIENIQLKPEQESSSTLKQSPIEEIVEDIIKSPTIHQQVVNLVEEENSIGDDILYYSLLSGCVKKDEDPPQQKKSSSPLHISNNHGASSSLNNTAAEKTTKTNTSNQPQKETELSLSESSSSDEDNYGKYFKSSKKKKKTKKPGIECEECREFYTACFPDDEEKRNRIIRECSRHRHGQPHHHHASNNKSPSLSNQSPVITGARQSSTPQATSSSSAKPSVNFDSVPGTPPEYWNLGDGPTDTYQENVDETQLSKSF